MSATLSTTLYGMLNFKRGKIKAIRHVINPTLTFTARPDFANTSYGYYREQLLQPENAAPDDDPTLYSIYKNGIFGGPPKGPQGTITLSISNNLEMKVFDKKDTLKQERKIKLLDRFSINNIGYNFIATEYKLSNPSFTGGVNLFEKVNVNFGGSFDPYAYEDQVTELILDEQTIVEVNRVKVDRYRIAENGGDGKGRALARFMRGNISLSTDFKFNQFSQRKTASETTKGTPEEREEVEKNPNYFMDFSRSSLGVNYDLNFQRVFNTGGELEKIDWVQTLNFRLNLNLTPKWKVNVRSGYDFANKKFAHTTVEVVRDLHCWEMLFNWIPVGPRQSYDFTIRVKSSVLSDLKLSRKRNWFDYESY